MNSTFALLNTIFFFSFLISLFTQSLPPAFTTATGNVGIGIDEPEMKLHVGGDLFVQTNLGKLIIGFPNNGNQWQFSTRGSGADLQIQSKDDRSTSFTT
jgi:hypothetical protein